MSAGPHPSRMSLQAWFDAEADPAVGHHIAGCRRCQAHLGILASVEAWVRGEPLTGSGDGRQRRAIAAWAIAGAATVLLLLLLLGLVLMVVRTASRNSAAAT